MTTETFKLSRPLKTHSGEVSEITMREPTGKSFIDHGEPFTLKPRVDANGEPDGVLIEYTNNKAMMGFIADMIEPRVDDLVLQGIGASDYQRLRAIAANIILAGVQDKNPTEPPAA